MKFLYRPCSEFLEDSMKQEKAYDSLKELIESIVKQNEEIFDNKRPFEIDDIYICYKGYDYRIDREVYLVTIRKFFNEDYMKKYHFPQAIGFLSFKK